MEPDEPVGRFDSEYLPVQGMTAAQIADAAVSTWARIDAVLAPIIGHGGVAALFKRSLHLSRGAYPWLEGAYAGALRPGDLGMLRAALQAQSDADAAGAHVAVLQAFHGLLANLIGAALSERLLGPVWDPTSSGDAAQDDVP
ncbi:hypothetical protein LDO32_19685 [Luteimonas sp. Y-2-2-4F]|nr:hypothetical protein [Luteimonas sp. Y-2-2-4F]MCD9033935.1 hypothetical protein [Luteimonas sp. Y-2-2-4F]